MILVKNRPPWDFRLADWRFQRVFRLLCYVGLHFAWVGVYQGKYYHCAHCGVLRKLPSGSERKHHLVSAFADLFDEMGPETPEEIDAELRAAGYNPDEVGQKIAKAAKEALEEAERNRG